MFKYLKKYWFFTLLAPLCMMGEVLMDLLQPGMMSTIVDDGVLGLSNGNVGDLSIVIHTGLRMIGVVFIGGVFGVLSGIFTSIASQNFGNDMRKDCFAKIMSLSMQQTDAFSTGSLITRVSNDITQVQNMVAQCIRGFVRMMMFFIGGTVCMLSCDLSFGVVLLCALPLVLFFVIYFVLKVTPLYRILQEKLDRVNAVMQENVTGARVVKAYVKEEYEEKRFFGVNQELVGTQLNVLLILSYMTPVLNIIMNLAVVAVIYVGSVRVEAGMVSPGKVMAAITYLSQILNSVMMLAMIFQTVSRGTASLNRLKEILYSEPSIADGSGAKTETEGIGGKVEFCNVSFAYPQSGGKKVLEEINLTIQPGETFAILGATGCGKSSLVNLIPRFYDATEGSVRLDGCDVRDYSLQELREKVAIALQKSELFSKSIRENISWGNPNADDGDIRRAARIAQAEEFILGQPEGYETEVAEKGMSLSGGQKQRIAISRAVLKKAKVLIFDDSTSALDLKTEAKLYQALNESYANVTKIIIAQRIASVRNADRIAVIENGRIVACAPHVELMKTSSVYQDIYESQLKEGGAMHE